MYQLVHKMHTVLLRAWPRVPNVVHSTVSDVDGDRNLAKPERIQWGGKEPFIKVRGSGQLKAQTSVSPWSEMRASQVVLDVIPTFGPNPMSSMRAHEEQTHYKGNRPTSC